MTLCAIDFLKVDMKATIGIDANKDVDTQLIALHEVLANTNSRNHISSIIVENGLREGINSERDLLGLIQRVRRVIKMANTTAILGISEAGSSWEKLLDVTEHLDIVGASVSPFYGGLSVEESTTWTYDFFRKGVIAPVARANPHATYFLSEIGWPSAGPAIFKAEPGLPQLQEFLDQWVCRNQRAQVGWYWQEAFDSTEGSYKWGLFERDRTHKNVTIPVC
jgi:exo-beta-1,3-glucanase (GH17 family)